MKRMMKKIIAALLVAISIVPFAGCFEYEQPEWVKQKLCDHVYDEEEIVREATCGRNGSVMKICSDCGDTKLVTIKATGMHAFDAGVAYNDSILYTCLVCGETKMEEVAFQEVSFTTGKITDTWYRVYFNRLAEDLDAGKLPDGITNMTVEFTSTENILTNDTEKFVLVVNPAGIGLLYYDVPHAAYTDDIVVEWHQDLGYVDFYIPSGTVLTTPETGGYPANYNGELTAQHEWSINEALSPYVFQLKNKK